MNISISRKFLVIMFVYPCEKIISSSAYRILTATVEPCSIVDNRIMSGREERRGARAKAKSKKENKNKYKIKLYCIVWLRLVRLDSAWIGSTRLGSARLYGGLVWLSLSFRCCHRVSLLIICHLVSRACTMLMYDFYLIIYISHTYVILYVPPYSINSLHEHLLNIRLCDIIIYSMTIYAAHHFHDLLDRWVEIHYIVQNSISFLISFLYIIFVEICGLQPPLEPTSQAANRPERLNECMHALPF